MPEEEYARIVRALAHLAAAWRDRCDFEALAALPDGTVVIDVMEGAARHESAGPVPLRLAPELQAALAERMARKGLAPKDVQVGELTLRFDTGAIATDRARIVHFDFDLEARLRAGGKEY